jgi:hypothetical protein
MSLDELAKDIPRIVAKYQLIDIDFDTECIYELGDLSSLLTRIVDLILSEEGIQIEEEISADGKHFIATLSNQKSSIVFTTNADSDWLSDEFFSSLEELSNAFGSDKKLYSINPAIGLTGQEAWYFYGTEEQLRSARKEGLPLVFPEEDFLETEEYQKYSIE